MRKRSVFCLFLLCMVLMGSLMTFGITSCSLKVEDSKPEENAAVFDGEQSIISWESFLSVIRGKDIEYPGWPDGREHLTNDELAQFLRNAALCQVDSTVEDFDDAIWTLNMYVGAPADDKMDNTHELRLSAGLTENLVRIWGGEALPDGDFYVENDDLYWVVRSINDIPYSIDEVALSKYHNAVDQYITHEQESMENQSITVELFSLEKCVDRSDIRVEIYTIGTVWTSESPKELLKNMTGGAYIDSQLCLHLDGNSTMPNMLVVNENPVGFLSWDGMSEIESWEDFRNGEDFLNSIRGNKAWFSPI